MSNLIKILSLNIFFLTLQPAVCMNTESALYMLSKIAISNTNLPAVNKEDAAIKESFYELCAYSVSSDDTKQILGNYRSKKTHPEIYDKWCEKLGLLNFLIPEEIETIKKENEQLVCSILIDLKNQTENLWAKYYAMHLLATFDLPCLNKLRGYGNFYDEYNNLTLSQAYKLESILTELSNQDVNLKIKAKANYNLAKLKYLQINKDHLKNFNKYPRHYSDPIEAKTERDRRPANELIAEFAFISCKNHLRTAQYFANLINHKTTLKLASDFIKYIDSGLSKN